MKKRGRMGVGMLSASVMIMGVYAATHLTQLTTEQTNFTSYAASTTNPKLTQSMWNGLVNKLDTLAKNHEERIRVLENAPSGPKACSPQTVAFNSIKFTKFTIRETKFHGDSITVNAKADINMVNQDPKSAGGLAPSWKAELRCENGTYKLVKGTEVATCANPGKESYNSILGTCGISCQQGAPAWEIDIDPSVGGGENIGYIDHASEGGHAKKCSAIKNIWVSHGSPMQIRDDDEEVKRCEKTVICNNGSVQDENTLIM